MRRVAVGLAGLAAGVLLSACGGPSQAEAAAIVGNDVVSLSQVQTQITSALSRTDQVGQLAQRGVGPEDIARDVVTRAILHDLLARRVAADGIVVPDAAVDSALAAESAAGALSETTLGSPEDIRTRVRDNLLAAELGKRSVGGLAVRVDILAATSQADADAKAATLAKGGPGAEALFGNPQTSARDQPFSAVSSPDDASTVLFGVPVGRVVVFQPDPSQASWIVFRVNQRTTDATVDPAALAQISQDQLTAIGQRALQPDAESAGIRVNPRYGVWDPIQQRVVGTEQVSGEILPAAAS